MPEGISTSLIRLATDVWVEAWDIVAITTSRGEPKVRLRHSETVYTATGYTNNVKQLIADIAATRQGTMPFV